MGCFPSNLRANSMLSAVQFTKLASLSLIVRQSTTTTMKIIIMIPGRVRMSSDGSFNVPCLVVNKSRDSPLKVFRGDLHQFLFIYNYIAIAADFE